LSSCTLRRLAGMALFFLLYSPLFPHPSPFLFESIDSAHARRLRAPSSGARTFYLSFPTASFSTGLSLGAARIGVTTEFLASVPDHLTPPCPEHPSVDPDLRDPCLKTIVAAEVPSFDSDADPLPFPVRACRIELELVFPFPPVPTNLCNYFPRDVLGYAA